MESKKFTIPKIKQKEYVSLAPPYERQEILKSVKESFLDRSYDLQKTWRVQSVQCCNNPKLLALYKNSQTELKAKNVFCKETHGFQLLNDKHNGLIHTIAEKGLRVGRTHCDKALKQPVALGKLHSGVQVVKYCDVLLNAAEQLDYAKIHIIVYKIALGKTHYVRPVKPYRAFDPTPQYNCHQSSSKENKSAVEQITNSVYYLYEYNADCLPKKRPRHVLPCAVISLKKRDTSKIVKAGDPHLEQLLTFLSKSHTTPTPHRQSVISDRTENLDWVNNNILPSNRPAMKPAQDLLSKPALKSFHRKHLSKETAVQQSKSIKMKQKGMLGTNDGVRSSRDTGKEDKTRNISEREHSIVNIETDESFMNDCMNCTFLAGHYIFPSLGRSVPKKATKRHKTKHKNKLQDKTLNAQIFDGLKKISFHRSHSSDLEKNTVLKKSSKLDPSIKRKRKLKSLENSDRTKLPDPDIAIKKKKLSQSLISTDKDHVRNITKDRLLPTTKCDSDKFGTTSQHNSVIAGIKKLKFHKLKSQDKEKPIKTSPARITSKTDNVFDSLFGSIVKEKARKEGKRGKDKDKNKVKAAIPKNRKHGSSTTASPTRHQVVCTQNVKIDSAATKTSVSEHVIDKDTHVSDVSSHKVDPHCSDVTSQVDRDDTSHHDKISASVITDSLYKSTANLMLLKRKLSLNCSKSVFDKSSDSVGIHPIVSSEEQRSIFKSEAEELPSSLPTPPESPVSTPVKVEKTSVKKKKLKSPFDNMGSHWNNSPFKSIFWHNNQTHIKVKKTSSPSPQKRSPLPPTYRRYCPSSMKKLALQDPEHFAKQVPDTARRNLFNSGLETRRTLATAQTPVVILQRLSRATIRKWRKRGKNYESCREKETSPIASQLSLPVECADIASNPNDHDRSQATDEPQDAVQSSLNDDAPQGISGETSVVDKSNCPVSSPDWLSIDGDNRYKTDRKTLDQHKSAEVEKVCVVDNGTVPASSPDGISMGADKLNKNDSETLNQHLIDDIQKIGVSSQDGLSKDIDNPNKTDNQHKPDKVVDTVEIDGQNSFCETQLMSSVRREAVSVSQEVVSDKGMELHAVVVQNGMQRELSGYSAFSSAECYHACKLQLAHDNSALISDPTADHHSDGSTSPDLFSDDPSRPSQDNLLSPPLLSSYDIDTPDMANGDEPVTRCSSPDVFGEHGPSTPELDSQDNPLSPPVLSISRGSDDTSEPQTFDDISRRSPDVFNDEHSVAQCTQESYLSPPVLRQISDVAIPAKPTPSENMDRPGLRCSSDVRMSEPQSSQPDSLEKRSEGSMSPDIFADDSSEDSIVTVGMVADEAEMTQGSESPDVFSETHSTCDDQIMFTPSSSGSSSSLVLDNPTEVLFENSSPPEMNTGIASPATLLKNTRSVSIYGTLLSPSVQSSLTSISVSDRIHDDNDGSSNDGDDEGTEVLGSDSSEQNSECSTTNTPDLNSQSLTSIQASHSQEQVHEQLIENSSSNEEIEAETTIRCCDSIGLHEDLHETHSLIAANPEMDSIGNISSCRESAMVGKDITAHSENEYESGTSESDSCRSSPELNINEDLISHPGCTSSILAMRHSIKEEEEEGGHQEAPSELMPSADSPAVACPIQIKQEIIDPDYNEVTGGHVNENTDLYIHTDEDLSVFNRVVPVEDIPLPSGTVPDITDIPLPSSLAPNYVQSEMTRDCVPSRTALDCVQSTTVRECVSPRTVRDDAPSTSVQNQLQSKTVPDHAPSKTPPNENVMMEVQKFIHNISDPAVLEQLQKVIAERGNMITNTRQGPPPSSQTKMPSNKTADKLDQTSVPLKKRRLSFLPQQAEASKEVSREQQPSSHPSPLNQLSEMVRKQTCDRYEVRCDNVSPAPYQRQVFENRAIECASAQPLHHRQTSAQQLSQPDAIDSGRRSLPIEVSYNQSHRNSDNPCARTLFPLESIGVYQEPTTLHDPLVRATGSPPTEQYHHMVQQGYHQQQQADLQHQAHHTLHHQHQAQFEPQPLPQPPPLHHHPIQQHVQQPLQQAHQVPKPYHPSGNSTAWAQYAPMPSDQEPANQPSLRLDVQACYSNYNYSTNQPIYPTPSPPARLSPPALAPLHVKTVSHGEPPCHSFPTPPPAHQNEQVSIFNPMFQHDVGQNEYWQHQQQFPQSHQRASQQTYQPYWTHTGQPPSTLGPKRQW